MELGRPALGESGARSGEGGDEMRWVAARSPRQAPGAAAAPPLGPLPRAGKLPAGLCTPQLRRSDNAGRGRPQRKGRRSGRTDTS